MGRRAALPVAMSMALLMAGCSRTGAHAPVPVQAPAPAHAPAPSPAAAPLVAKAPAPAQPSADALLRAIFADHYQPGAHAGVIHVDDDKLESPFYAVTIAAVTELPDGRTVVVANGSPSDETGESRVHHTSQGLLNVYVLRRDREGGRWQVLERHENVESLGSSALIGDVAWITLAPGRPGFVVASGGNWQGATLYGQAVYALDDGVRSLGVVGGHSDNVGACQPGMDDCWEVDGKLRVADTDTQPGPYRDILADFSGRHYTLTEGADGNNVEQVKTQVHQSARYHFDGKSYVRVEGEEPLPSI